MMVTFYKSSTYMPVMGMTELDSLHAFVDIFLSFHFSRSKLGISPNRYHCHKEISFIYFPTPPPRSNTHMMDK